MAISFNGDNRSSLHRHRSRATTVNGRPPFKANSRTLLLHLHLCAAAPCAQVAAPPLLVPSITFVLAVLAWLERVKVREGWSQAKVIGVVLIICTLMQHILPVKCYPVRFLLSPLGAVPVVTLTGLRLFKLESFYLGQCFEVALPALVTQLILSQYIPPWMRSTGVYRFAVISSIAIAWVFAAFLTTNGTHMEKPIYSQIICCTDRAGLIKATPWIRIPYPFQWGMPIFKIEDVSVIIVASLVAVIESTGTFIATSRLGSATPITPSVVSRGIG